MESLEVSGSRVLYNLSEHRVVRCQAGPKRSYGSGKKMSERRAEYQGDRVPGRDSMRWLIQRAELGRFNGEQHLAVGKHLWIQAGSSSHLRSRAHGRWWAQEQRKREARWTCHRCTPDEQRVRYGLSSCLPFLRSQSRSSSPWQHAYQQHVTRSASAGQVPHGNMRSAFQIPLELCGQYGRGGHGTAK